MIVDAFLTAVQLGQIGLDLIAQAQQYLQLQQHAASVGRAISRDEIEAYIAADNAARERQLAAVAARRQREQAP